MTKHVLYATTVLIASACAAHGAIITHLTDFDSATPVGSDGRGTSFGANGGATFDTTQGWTFYTLDSTTNDNLTIPFGAGTQTIGEKGIRVGAGLELQSNSFFFGYGGGNFPIALRSQNYADVGAGNANVAWSATAITGFKAFYSQNSGTSWTALTNGANFTAALGSLEVVFVANDGADSNTVLDTATISYQAVPEPGTLAMLLIGSVFMWMFRRK